MATTPTITPTVMIQRMTVRIFCGWLINLLQIGRHTFPGHQAGKQKHHGGKCEADGDAERSGRKMEIRIPRQV